MGALDRTSRGIVNRFVTERGYQFLNLDRVEEAGAVGFDKYEHLANLDVAIRFVDSRARRSMYWAGAVSAAAVPTITITIDPDYLFSDRFPREFQPRPANLDGVPPLEEVLKREFDLFEQDFLKAQDAETLEKYFNLQMQAGALGGRYESQTRNYYMENIMGDKYTVSGQAGAVGPQAHAHDITFSGVWNQLEKSVDIAQLAEQLGQLHAAMEREASERTRAQVGGRGGGRGRAKRKATARTENGRVPEGWWQMGLERCRKDWCRTRGNSS
jgi:hypothetical protein